jgi:hypothetical protein
MNINSKKISTVLIFLISSVLISSCANINKDINNIFSNKKNCYLENDKYKTNSPKWYKEFKQKKEFFYLIKNYESSGDKDLAQQKNILIAKMKLANVISDTFMSCNDQKQMASHIRDIKNKEELNKYQRSNLVKNLIEGYVLIREETLEEENIFTSFIILSKIKK